MLKNGKKRSYHFLAIETKRWRFREKIIPNPGTTIFGKTQGVNKGREKQGKNNLKFIIKGELDIRRRSKYTEIHEASKK